MKINEAPEKIYLFENPITETPDDRWLSKRSDENDIEYTRTDALIEKVINFLNYKLGDVVNVRVPGTLIPETMARQDFVDEFIKFMES